MRKLYAWLGAATLLVLTSVYAQAAGPSVLKPYVVLILDTSGSMIDTAQGNPTGYGPPTCVASYAAGNIDNKLNHAKCAIDNIANSYGDIVFGLARFRNDMSGVPGTFPAGCCSDGPDDTGGGCNGPVCTATDEMFELLTPLIDGNNATTAKWVDGTANSCTAAGTDPEIWAANSNTPLGGVLFGAQDYFEGVQAHTIAIAASPGGATEAGTTATFTTTAANNFVLNESVLVSGVGVAGYNGTWTVATIVSTTKFTATLGAAGLAASGGGTAQTLIMTPGTTGFDPINSDPVNNVFLPEPGTGVSSCNPNPTTCNAAIGHCSITTGTSCQIDSQCPGGETCKNECTGANCCCSQQCRPYIVILLTDGDETCGGNSPAAATALLTTKPHNDAVAISAIVRMANSVTVMTSAPIMTTVGQNIVIAAVTNASFNGTFAITSVTSTTSFTYAQTAVNAASSGGTAGHAAFQDNYRIVTKPIGFGTPVPYAPIEAIANAAGAVGPGNHGYYASNQSDIELAISQIIEGSIRSETCNGLDDDCDGRIDEDFPTKGNACTNGELGLCAVNGTLVCRADGTGLICSAGQAACNGLPDNTACSVTDTNNVTVAGTCLAGICNPTPQTEICGNGIDDDCDGIIDEGCATCVPQAEICNGKDDDCDGNIDEDIPPRPCGITNAFGTCPGTQACVGGAYTACMGQTPTAEVCDGLDNNCDGIADGFTVGCSTIFSPNGPSTDNPGDPMHVPPPIPQNVCHPGEKDCPISPPGNGTFGACIGEVQGCNPQQNPGIHCDLCDGLDNDCDNKIDEDFVSTPCTSQCGVGMTQCLAGTITCNAQPATIDNTCNNIDDDCDGQIDEDWACGDPASVPFVPCACGTGVVCNGVNKCVNGTVECVGGPINIETCNCLDDDCDGRIDEGVTCPGGATCTNCQCAFACNAGEFPCPLGKKCTNSFCVNDPCYGVTCPNVNGNAQTCFDNGNNTSMCVDTCTVTTCQAPEICYAPSGLCRPNDCTTFGCPDPNANCIVDNTGVGTCVTNPCAGVTCPTDQYCEAGTCYGSCVGVTCPAAERCQLGTCMADPCGHQCPYGEACNDATGVCIADPCQFRICPQGDACNPDDGQCEPDPCLGVTCPGMGQVCKQGSCYDPSTFLPDAGIESHVTVGGGGCNTTGGGSSAGLVLGVMAMLVRRRRRGDRS